MNSKSIFKKLVCPKCRKWSADETGKAVEECASCGVKKVPSDKWHVRITSQGTTTVRAISSRRSDAVDYLHAAKDAARRGQLLPGEEKPITWADAKKEFLKWVDSGTLATGTKEWYKGQIAHLSSHFDSDLQDITVSQAENYLAKRMAVVAIKTAAEEIKTLKRLFALHCRWNSARKAPSLHAVAADLGTIQMPRYNNKRTRFLTEAESQLMVKTCTVPHLKLAIQIALLTGLRYGNIVGLEWKQIDFINRTITFKPEEMKSKRLHITPLAEPLANAMVAWRKAQKKISPFVFPSPTAPGKHMDNMRTTWENLIIECNKILKKEKKQLLDDVVFHTLRHTFASHFLMKGGDLATLSELLDHASINITKDRYGHLSNEYKKTASDRFSAQFSGDFFKAVSDR